MSRIINTIPKEDFRRIKAELDALPANSQERSELAFKYLEDYDLPKEVSDRELLEYFFGDKPAEQPV